MKIVVCGSRNWNNQEVIKRRLSQLPRSATIISGGARGADTLAIKIAAELGFERIGKVLAEWKKYGRAAGPMRNIRMLDMKPDLVIAFHENLIESRGTAHTVREARLRGIPVEVIGG
jgi:hypothetical protein